MGEDHLKLNTEELLSFKKINPYLVKLTNQQINSFRILFQLSCLVDSSYSTRSIVQEIGQIFREAFLFLMSGKPKIGLYMVGLALEHTKDVLRLLDYQQKSNWRRQRAKRLEGIESERSIYEFDHEDKNEKTLSEMYDLFRGAKPGGGVSKVEGYIVSKKEQADTDLEKNVKTNGWLWNHVFLRVQAALIAKLLKICDGNNEDIKILSNQWIKEWKIASRRVTLWSKNTKLG